MDVAPMDCGSLCIISPMGNLAIIIPARLGATRFPKKMLHPVLGKPLILWTVEAASESKLAKKVIVATDSEEILKVVTEAGFEAEMTSPDHQSGTDRAWEVASRLDSDWILNLQGDEPLMKAEVLDSLVETALESEKTVYGSEKTAHGSEKGSFEADNKAGQTCPGSCEMATLIRDLDPSEFRDPNRVKVVTDIRGNALYFSRSPIPYPRLVPELSIEDQDPARYLLHVGVYLYRRDILERIVKMPRSPLEKTEGLEQLRALENGISIRCVKTEHEFLGVDSISDVPRVEAILRARFSGKSGISIDI
jgi:3-deoxy-manno-octulosonate cytidylyltransferase (CMP-KDO synthetase)